MEQFLYRIQPVRHDMLTRGANEVESGIISDHFNYLKRLTEGGVVILAGRTQNTDYSSFGIVLLKAESIEAAREIMLNDPAVKNNVFRAELYPYETSLFNPDKPSEIIPGSRIFKIPRQRVFPKKGPNRTLYESRGVRLSPTNSIFLVG